MAGRLQRVSSRRGSRSSVLWEPGGVAAARGASSLERMESPGPEVQLYRRLEAMEEVEAVMSASYIAAKELRVQTASGGVWNTCAQSLVSAG